MLSTVSYKNKGYKNKPDFLCIGPHKTGTTWLYVKLDRHPEIWLPPQKELWVLNSLSLPYWQQLKNLLTRSKLQGEMRKSFEKGWQGYFRPRGFFEPAVYARLWWWFIYLLRPYRLSTYPTLFSQNPALMAGDITPNYYFLSDDVIEQLQQQQPNLKIIIILRNPVERAWSYARMSATNRYHRPVEAISEQAMIAYLDEIHSQWRTYPNSIERWQRYFSETFVTYFDLLQENPTQFHDQICHFLGVGTSTYATNLSQSVNASPSFLPSQSIQAHLARQYRHEVQVLAERYHHPYVMQWLTQMEKDIEQDNLLSADR